MNKYAEALSLYNTELNDEEVAAKVAKLIEEKVEENNTLEVKKFLMGSIELTTLKSTDSDESVMKFVERVNDYDNEYPDLPHLATICVYPCFASIVSNTLQVEGVEIACVSGSFPSSQALLGVKVAETALAGNGIEKSLPFQLLVGSLGGNDADAQILGQVPDGGKGVVLPQCSADDLGPDLGVDLLINGSTAFVVN